MRKPWVCTVCGDGAALCPQQRPQHHVFVHHMMLYTLLCMLSAATILKLQLLNCPQLIKLIASS